MGTYHLFPLQALLAINTATNQRTRQLINRATSYKGSHVYLWCLQTQEPVCTESLLCLSEREADPAQGIPTRSTHPAHPRAAEQQTPSSCVGKSHEDQEGWRVLKCVMLRECLHPRSLLLADQQTSYPFSIGGQASGKQL